MPFALVAVPLLFTLCFLFERYVLVPLIRRFDTIQEYVFLTAIGWCLGIAQLAADVPAADAGAARFLNVESKYGGHYLPENSSWAKQTVAHNTLVVDEGSHFGGNWKAGQENNTELLHFEAGERADVAMAGESTLVGLGWLLLAVGHLQLLSVVFSVILIGLGIDFAVHMVARLELIQDVHLRARLASWPPIIADIRDNELATREIVVQIAHPLFAEHGVPLSRASEAVHEGSWPAVVPPSVDAATVYSKLVRDPRFTYVASQRYMVTANSAREYAAAAEAAEGLVVLVRDALGGSGSQR